MLQTSRRTPSPPPPLGRPLQLHELPSSHRPVLWPRTVGSSTAGQTCDDQDGAARGESRPCVPQGRPLLLRFLPGAGDSQADIVGRGRPTPQLPTPGRKWGWRSRLEKLLIAAGPFGLVPDSGCLSPPSTSGRDGNPGLSRLRPPPVRDTRPCPRAAAEVPGAAVGGRGGASPAVAPASRTSWRPRVRSSSQGCPCPQPVPTTSLCLGPFCLLGFQRISAQKAGH